MSKKASNIIKTIMLKKYLIKFAIRIAIFLSVGTLYLYDKSLIYEFMATSVWNGISPMHVLWLVFMVMMLRHIFHTDKATMALRKADEKEYTRCEEYSELELLKFVQDQNVKAWKVMLFWLSANAVFGLLVFLTGVIL